MSLEIRELYIKVTVNQPAQQNPAVTKQSEGKKEEDDKDGIISQCVDEVVNIINNKKER